MVIRSILIEHLLKLRPLLRLELWLMGQLQQLMPEQ
jgi:hypothetical protein